MKISVLLHTAENRGDHAADVVIAHDVIDGETVSELCHRLLGCHNTMARIELRLIASLPTAADEGD